jgi:DHA3 family macrolide efflux protein-like MFS transporter
MRLLVPLRTPAIALLWGGMSLSAIGDQLYIVALSWIAVSVFGSAAGYLTALQGLVILLAALGVGSWADRWEPHASLIGADLVRALTLLLVVAAWLATGGPAAASLVAAVIVLAAGQAVFQPALQTVLPRLATDLRLLPATNGLMDTTERTARLLGPGLVALLAGVLPTVHFLTLDAASFLASAAAVALIRRRGAMIHPRAPARRESAWAGISRGARAMSAHPLLGFVLRTTALINGAWYAAFFLSVPLLIERAGITGPGGTGLGAYGLVIAAYGSTNLASTLVFGGRPMPSRPGLQMFGGSLLVACGITLMGFAALLPPPLILPGLATAAALGAAGGPMKDIPVAVLRQTRLHPADIAAAMRAYMAANAAGMLAAMLLTPSLLGIAGPARVILASGLLLAGAAMAGLVRFARWSDTAAA